MYDYFYGPQADQFNFIRIPAVLFSKEEFKCLSSEAKVLYGILLKRMDLSAKNGWLDEQGRVFIICTLEEIMETMNCADNKATKLMNELEEKCGLIERKRQGQGKPNLIYVKNFISSVDNSGGQPPESRFKTRENHDSGVVKTTNQESLKSRGSYKDNNDTDYSHTENPIYPGRDEEEMRARMICESFFEDQIEYDYLLDEYPYERETIRGILDLLVDTYCSKRKYIRVAGDDKPADVVKSQIAKLNSSHIQYVMDCLKENTTDVRNIKQYLLAALYNAPTTISPYYQAKVNYDFYGNHD